jgi:hypothetical protein
MLSGVAAFAQERSTVSASVGAGAISFASRVPYDSASITISGPGGWTAQETLGPEDGTSLRLGALPDGQYVYEVRVAPRVSPATRESLAARARGDVASATAPDGFSQSGSFQVVNGAVVSAGGTEPYNVVVADNQIVQGSLCVGIDCVNAETFDFDTIKLKENNTRIRFDDTSATAGFPNVDWQLTANDSASGGANRFFLEDLTNARVPLSIAGGAPNNALFVAANGKVGFRTATPVLDLHVSTGDTPAMRLDQNGSGGWAPQSWDVAGNEANFFVRDVTGGSLLPFKIRPGAPTNSLVVTPVGTGVGVDFPTAPLHVRRADGTTQVLIEDTSAAPQTRRLLDMHNNGGIRMRLQDNSTGTAWAYQNIASNFNIDANGGANEFSLTPAGNLTITGSLTQLSDRGAKTGFAPVDPHDVLARIVRLPVSSWSYTADGPAIRHIGPMAQDFAAAFGLGPDDRHIAPSDVGGVALAAIKALSQMVDARDEQIRALERHAAEMARRLEALEALVARTDTRRP